MKGRLLLTAEITVLVLVAIFMAGALRGEHEVSSEVSEYILENGSGETGALNLVTALYLGYRLFDTMGETIVLLISVSGVIFFMKWAEGKE